MPVQDSWVEMWLDRYCEPGTHRSAWLRAGVWGCTQCGKEELMESRSCVICGLPGDRTVAFDAVVNPQRRLEGVACGICFDEFVARTVIRGWKFAAAG